MTGQGFTPKRQFLTSPGDSLSPGDSSFLSSPPPTTAGASPRPGDTRSARSKDLGGAGAWRGGRGGGRRGRGFCSRTRSSAAPRSCLTSDFPLLTPKMIPKPTQRQGGSFARRGPGPGGRRRTRGRVRTHPLRLGHAGSGKRPEGGRGRGGLGKVEKQSVGNRHGRRRAEATRRRANCDWTSRAETATPPRPTWEAREDPA